MSIVSKEITYGDYTYTLEMNTANSVTKAKAVATDKTKSSYGTILSSIVDDGDTYPVIDLTDCFADCVNLTTSPTIPESIKFLQRTFSGCSNLTTAPIIPNSVSNMDTCFENCTSLTIAPDIPGSVESLSYCFKNCTNLIIAPCIPTISQFYSCFNGCTSLTKVIIGSEGTFIPIDDPWLDGIFDNTSQTILVCKDNSITSLPQNWNWYIENRSNVYAAFDNTAPQLKVTATRTDEFAHPDDEGSYAQIRYKVTLYEDTVPQGSNIELEARKLYFDGVEVQSPQWTKNSGLDEISYTTLYQLPDGNKHTFRVWGKDMCENEAFALDTLRAIGETQEEDYDPFEDGEKFITAEVLKNILAAFAESLLTYGIDGRNAVMLGSTPPQNPILGTLWVDGGNGNVLKFWDGSAWSYVGTAWAS